MTRDLTIFSDWDKITRYSMKDVIEVMEDTYKEMGENAPISEYNNRFIINLRNKDENIIYIW